MFHRGLLLLWVILLGCGKDPLSDRVEVLEGQVAELQAEREAERQALLVELDQVSVTEENAAEVADIRAKLNQTGVTVDDLNRLKTRVDALERLVVDWSRVLSNSARAVYAVLHGVVIDSQNTEITFLATGFAVDPQRLVTNAHVVDALIQLDGDVIQFNTKYGTRLKTGWIVVQNLTTTLQYKQNFFIVSNWAKHRDWAPDDFSSADVGVLFLSEGTFFSRLDLLSSNDSFRLKTGEGIATIGFPGELQGGDLNNLFPIGTAKVGIISALKPHEPGVRYSVSDTYIVQHNLDLSGGTSGSPILNTAGKAIAVNNSGIEGLVLTVGGEPARISQSSLGFGIRADRIQQLLTTLPASAKPVGAFSAESWLQLEGRETEELEIRDNREDLEKRLEQRLHK